MLVGQGSVTSVSLPTEQGRETVHVDTEIVKEIERAAQAAVGDKLREIIAERELPKLITKPKLLELLGGISYVTLWTRQCAGEFPKGKIICGRTMFELDAVRAWIERQPEQKLKGD